jgi:hypothetical protein
MVEAFTWKSRQSNHLINGWKIQVSFALLDAYLIMSLGSHELKCNVQLSDLKNFNETSRAHMEKLNADLQKLKTNFGILNSQL